MLVQSVNTEEKTVQIDDNWHKVIFPALKFFDSIEAGDDVDVRFDKKPEKNIVFIRKFDIGREGDMASGQYDEKWNKEPVPENQDPYKPLGNLFAMCEEKLNAIIEQNSKINSLLFEVAKKVGVDTDIKKASETDDKQENT